MKLLRLLLFPFAILYGTVTAIRNFLYDKGIYKSYTFSVPVIAVGNLSTGGTGKTPQIEYLIRLLSANYKIATLSRGYKRKSKGFVLGNADSDAAMLGDEPYQFYKKFSEIEVAVDANRKNGIEQLLKLSPKPEIILLDDAYQHRRVKSGLYILLTAYGDIYADDYILPAGNLREGRSGAKRAAVIVVTKCPPTISLHEREKIVKKLKPQPGQRVYFTFIEYDDKVYSETVTLNASKVKLVDKLLVAGIAKPQPFFSYLEGDNNVNLTYPDHHDFSEKDIIDIENKSQNKIIVTTEKDYVRLQGKLPGERLFYLPIKSSFIAGGNDFDKTILDFVKLFPVGGNRVFN
jgi:tetraacyldisaccharide 4'-kinase